MTTQIMAAKEATSSEDLASSWLEIKKFSSSIRFFFVFSIRLFVVSNKQKVKNVATILHYKSLTSIMVSYSE